MNQNNPFGDYIDDDKTIIRPNPGGRRHNLTESPPPSTEPRAEMSDALREKITSFSNNPLTGCANTLLTLSAQLRNTITHPDIAGLRNSVINEIKIFENALKKQNIDLDQIQAARYALCAMLDEAVLHTPWGGSSLWNTQGLLVFFHKETYGGEKFFLVLKNSMQQPARHLNLLELLYFCLCLGFEGKYRILEHGATRLEEERENLYQLIQRQRGYSERELSRHWQGIKDERNVLVKLVPLWVITALSITGLMFVFLGFLYAISNASDPIIYKIYGIKDEFKNSRKASNDNTSIPIQNTPVIDAAFTKLQTFLAPEVQRGEVSVVQENGKTLVRILSKGLFASGSDQLSSQYYPLIEKISSELTKISGQIVVSGHTDNINIHTIRFPSNQALSQARAQTVVDRLRQNKQLQSVIVAEGRGDSMPLIANDTPEHRAMNRRVEISF